MKTALKKLFDKAEKVALLGVGSDLRGDDAAGLLVAKLLSQSLKKHGSFKVFFGDTAPENLTGEIKRFCPTHLVIVDSADMHEAAGVVKLINPDQVGGLSFCTHSLPVKIMADYLVQSLGCQIAIIGIQPKALDFGSSVSKEIKKAVNDIAGVLTDVLKSCLP